MTTTTKRTLPLSKRGFSFETIMWAFTRLTAFAMYGLILAGFIGALVVSAQTGVNFGDVLRWALLPNTAANPIAHIVWMTILAKLMVIVFMLVVSGHGVHGILEILDDYYSSAIARRWFRNFVIAYALVTNAIVLYVIFTR